MINKLKKIKKALAVFGKNDPENTIDLEKNLDNIIIKITKKEPKLKDNKRKSSRSIDKDGLVIRRDSDKFISKKDKLQRKKSEGLSKIHKKVD